MHILHKSMHFNETMQFIFKFLTLIALTILIIYLFTYYALIADDA